MKIGIIPLLTQNEIMSAITGCCTCVLQKNCYIIGVFRVTNGTAASSEELIITTKQSVSVFKESKAKPYQIWTSKPSEPLTCAAVFKTSSKKYAACVNHKLLVWDSATLDITKVKPIKVESSIQQIYPLASGGCATLYSDGAVYATSDGAFVENMKNPRSGFLKSYEEILDSCLHSCQGEVFVVCLVKENMGYSLCCIQVPAIDQLHTDMHITRVKLNTPSGHTLQHSSFYVTNNDGLCMYSVWNEGKLYKSAISCLNMSSQTQMGCQPVIQLPTNKQHVKQVKIAGVTSTLVAVVGLQGEYTDHLCLWDTKHGILVAKQQLCNPADKLPVLVSNIFYASSHVWLSTNQGITVCRIETAPTTLSMALGKQGTPLDELKRIQSAGQQWRFDEQNAESDAAMDIDDVNHTATNRVLEELLNTKKVRTTKQFNSAIQQLLSIQERSSVGTATALCNVLSKVSDMWKDNKRFWPSDGLLAILQTGLVAASSCTEFVTCVIENGDAALLMKCLQHMQDIPDATLAQILQFILRDLSLISEETPANSGTCVELHQHCPISPDASQIINLVLQCPMNDSFMLECLARVDFQQIMVLLNYLFYLLNTISAADGKNQEQLPANVVIDWIMLILDAHYPQLVLSAKARPLLVRLHQIVETLSNYFDEVDAVQNMLQHFETKATTATASEPKATADGFYSIEILKL